MPPLDISVRRTTAAQQVAEGLFELIMSGRFEPGTRLRESAIAADLGIARNTVREAVRILELGGLVRHEVNRGAVVIAPTTDSVLELYGARARLEVAAARQLPLSDTDLEPIQRALDGLRRAALDQEVGAIVAADLAFHSAIVGLLRNNRIDEFYGGLTTELRFYLTVLTLRDREFDSPDSIIEQHANILRALEGGDPDEAAGVIQTHIDQNVARVCEILSAQQEAAKRREPN